MFVFGINIYMGEKVVVDCFDYFFICEEIEGVYYIDEFDRFWNVGYCNVENVVFFFF